MIASMQNKAHGSGSATQTNSLAAMASSIRRKPQLTYKSPSISEGHLEASTLLALSRKQPPSQSTSKPSSSLAAALTTANVKLTPRPRAKTSMGPPLPLYHPLGQLALSLPPLDPASFGLPAPIILDRNERRSSARERRPAAKLRDTEEEPSPLPSPSLSVIASVAARETAAAVKPSPRKKRNAGGAGNKRKRKEVEDSDPTYPAKRTRNPRGQGSLNADEDEAAESIDVVPVVPEVTPTPEPDAMQLEEKSTGPERRSTRSRAPAKRRDSSASEANSGGSAGIGTAVASNKGKSSDAMEVDKNSDQGRRSSRRSRSKEDGEVSEEGRPS